jgi:protein TonB
MRAERPAARPRNLPLAILSSVGVHAAVWFGAWRAGAWARVTAADARANAPIEVSVEPSVAPPEPTPIPPPPEPAWAAGLAKRPSLPSTRPTPPRAEAAPSSSGATSTEPAPGPSAPVDLTGETPVSASTRSPVGGIGEANGSGARAGQRSEHSLGAPSTVGSRLGDRSGGVSLEERSWVCPWPHEAETQQIDEQTVVIKVVVAPDGMVERAIVLSDPGHGFGPAAIACALRTRFIAARDRDGRSIRSESPPVLVRFTR